MMQIVWWRDSSKLTYLCPTPAVVLGEFTHSLWLLLQNWALELIKFWKHNFFPIQNTGNKILILRFSISLAVLCLLSFEQINFAS